MSLTKDDARIIADSLLEAAQEIDRYLDNNYQKISREEYEFLNESFKTLVRVSAFATTMAVGLAIEELDDPADKLKSVIEQAKDKIENLQKIGQIINLAAGLTDLAAGIMAKDPKAILKSFKKLGSLLETFL